MRSTAAGGETQKVALANAFKDAGWKSNQILQDLKVSANFYGDESGFIKMGYWSRRAVVLVGDAAYGSSGMTGMGTTSAIVGAYVLAGEISKEFNKSFKGNVQQSLTAALDSYEAEFRPFIDQIQKGLSDNSPILIGLCQNQ